MVDTTNFNIVPNDDEEQFTVEFGEIMNTGVIDFNELIHRPKYNNSVMTGETSIPVVPSRVSELENNLNYQTESEVENKVALEATARQQADTQIQGTITALSGDLSNEISSRATADTALGERITRVSNDLGSETAARQGADRSLQEQIDGISASSDVKDIVGTYAELEAYDTSTLGNNDIIKVLQDEAHSNETTYYRWSTTTHTFTLIGEEGPYYTKSATDQLLNTKADKATTYTKTETDNLLSGKQNTLTPGTNIIISGNTISAADTTYLPFVGTDGQTAGSAGLVPAPSTTEANRFLKSDGTWGLGGESMIVENISGTAPVITAESNHIYVCGEVGTLDFTPSATGVCEVIFTSGATPTTLVIPNTVRMPDWFVIQPNSTYEISIFNGVYGAVTVWNQ